MQWREYMSKLAVVVLSLALAGCGSNQITVEIKGGDGQMVRLDANKVQYKYNTLDKAGPCL